MYSIFLALIFSFNDKGHLKKTMVFVLKYIDLQRKAHLIVNSYSFISTTHPATNLSPSAVAIVSPSTNLLPFEVWTI